MKYLSFILIIFISASFYSCDKEESVSQEEQLKIDIDKIEAYLKSNDLTAEKTDSGLHYIITNSGSGAHPNLGSNVTVQYTGRLLDGTEFDSGTATFPLTNVIQGWQEGIPLFKRGGRGQLFIPSYIGYGVSGSSSIPPNSVLIFDIYLVSFN